MIVWIDNRYFEVNNNYTIYQFCAKIGINLPCFCYHERLSIAGNCRICVVEANNAMVISCATLLLDNMKIFTKNKRIKKARESILEFLLVNHPLDCPICDQGGECDLQDILITYGSDRGRFYELNKKSVTNLNCCGPFIKTVMTRCIHCTRCVRFINEISSVYDFGVIGRGSNMEIGTYILNHINDELLGNIIDLCPVGALISMPSSFTGRNWEIKYMYSIDILDSICSTIKLGISNNNVVRVIPSLDEFYSEWITNKARFVYDSYNIQRLSYPKIKLNYKFIIISWKLALKIYLFLLFNKINNYIQIFCGVYISLDLAFTLKSFFNNIGCSNIYYTEKIINLPDMRYSFLLNNTVKNLLDIFDLLFIGCNLRIELPLLNSMFRKSYLNNSKFRAYSIGLCIEYLTYPVINLGSSLNKLYKFILGLSLVNKYFLYYNYYNMNFFDIRNIISMNIIVGSAVSIRNDYNFILNSIFSFISKFESIKINDINIISRHLGKISFIEYNLYYNINIESSLLKKKSSVFNFLVGVDHLNVELKNKLNVNIFLGFFHISKFFEYINLVLPSNIYIEDNFCFLNLEGRYRFTNKVLNSKNYVYTDYNIVKSLFILFKLLFKSNFSIFPNFDIIVKRFTLIYNFFFNYLLNIRNIKNIINNNNLFNNNLLLLNHHNMKYNNTILSKLIYNYYNDDIFCKMSLIITQQTLKMKVKNNLYN